jgi:hypothetical protein
LNYKIEYSKQSKIFGIFFAIFFLIGMIAGYCGIINTRNYYHAYLFFFIFAVSGFVSGHFISKFLKPYFRLTEKQMNSFGFIKMFLMAGLTGILLETGSVINSKTAYVICEENCVVVTKKEVTPIHRIRPGANYLFVKLQGDVVRLYCNNSYWQNKKVGDRVPVQIFKSKFGFDYIELRTGD